MNVQLITKKAYMSLILLILSASIVYSGYYITSLLSTNEKNSLANVDNVEWYSVKVMIDEEYGKAQINVANISEKIKSDVLVTYNNNDTSLLNDLNTPTANSKVIQILNNDIKGKYLNVDNSNNGLFVLSPTKGILADLSLTCTTKGPVRTLATEVSLHSNKALATQALYDIVSQSANKYIFWDSPSTPTSYSTSTPSLQYMDINGVKDIFYKYGLNGLQDYEFLTPYYINQYDDILGQPDVGGLGIKQDNNKIIVVQGFNIIDDINVNHPDFEMFYSNLRSSISSTDEMEASIVSVVTILLCIICFTCFVTVIREINKIL
jgi:hypothetical protein